MMQDPQTMMRVGLQWEKGEEVTRILFTEAFIVQEAFIHVLMDFRILPPPSPMRKC